MSLKCCGLLRTTSGWVRIRIIHMLFILCNGKKKTALHNSAKEEYVVLCVLYAVQLQFPVT